jgi:hypothetical protein
MAIKMEPKEVIVGDIASRRSKKKTIQEKKPNAPAQKREKAV